MKHVNYLYLSLLPILYVLTVRGLGLGDAIFGSLLSTLLIVTSIYGVKSSREEIQLEKTRLKQEQEIEKQLHEAQLKLEYESKVSRLEDQLKKNALEKIKRF